MFTRPLVLLALLGTLAGAAPATPAALCQISEITTTLSAYRATQETRGTVQFRVSCPAGGAHAVRLGTPRGPLSGPVAALHLGGRGGGEAHAELHDIPADLSVIGARTFALTIVVPAGQWGLAGGTYTLPLSITTEPLGTPAGDTP